MICEYLGDGSDIKAHDEPDVENPLDVWREGGENAEYQEEDRGHSQDWQPTIFVRPATPK